MQPHIQGLINWLDGLRKIKTSSQIVEGFQNALNKSMKLCDQAIAIAQERSEKVAELKTLCQALAQHNANLMGHIGTLQKRVAELEGEKVKDEHTG